MASRSALMRKGAAVCAVVKAGRCRGAGTLARPRAAEERRIPQALLDDVHGQFIAAVADGRKLDRAVVRRFADGRVFSGTQAKALHMIDELGEIGRASCRERG